MQLALDLVNHGMSPDTLMVEQIGANVCTLTE